MFKTTTAKLKKLMLVLFVVMLTFTLTLAVACTKKTDDDNGSTDTGKDSTEETTTVTDYQGILNGDFEFKTDDKTSYPYLSSINWTRSYGRSVNSAPSSKASGIIDTTDDKYNSLSADVKPVDGETTINPRTPYYYGLVKNDYDKDDEAKRVNPNVAGSKVLLLNNNVTGGTAQKVTSSSSVTVSFEKYGLISVWVKTEIKDATKGAYVSLEPTVGSKTLDPITVKNVNTDGKWAKFTFYIHGSNLNNATVKLTLGLGEGNGSLKAGYVEGFAYFDNAEFKEITKKEYDDSLSEAINLVQPIGTCVPNGEAAEYKDEETAKAKYSEFKYQVSLEDNLSASAINQTDLITKSEFFKDDKNLVGDIVGNNKIGYKKASEIVADGNVSEEVKTAVKDEGYALNDKEVMYFDFKTASSATATGKNLTLGAGKYVAYSFLTKVKVSNKSTYGLNVKYKELSYANATGSENGDLDKDAVSVFSNIKVYEVENGTYGDWTKYVVLFSNPTADDITFNFSFTFGIDKASKTVYPDFELPSGYALVTDFTELGTTADPDETHMRWTEEKYNNFISSGESVKNTLLGRYSSYSDDETEDDKDDSYNLTADSSQLAVIPNRPTTSVNGFAFKGDDDKVVHGVINSKYIESGKYGKSGVVIEDLDKLETLKTYNLNANAYNKYAQALVLSNKEALSSAFITTKATLSANSYTLITVKLKVYGEAVANVYLTGTDYNYTDKRYDVLSLKDNDGVLYELKATANKDTKNVSASEDGFITLSFYVATGNKDIDYRVEIWNGTRDGSKNSKGTVYIDNVYVSDVSSTDVDLNGRFAFEDIIASEYGAMSGYEFKSATYTRVPTTVKYTDSDKKKATKQELYQPGVILSQNDVTTFAYYTTVDVESERDETTASDNDNESGDTTDDEYKVNPTGWLQVVSIILAVVLIIAVVAVIFRTNTKKTAKQKVKKQEYYHRDTREKALKKIAADKKAINVEKDESDDKEYDYSAAENVEETAEAEAEPEVTEEPAESENKADETVDFNELTQEPVEATESPETAEEVTESENGDKQE